MAGKGRPKFEITDEVIAKTEKLAGQGLTKKQISRALGISYGTLNVKTKEYSNFSEAIKSGQAKGLEIITNALFNSAKDGNITAQIFYLKNRAPEEWKDRVPEGAGINEAPPTRIEIVTIDGRKVS